MSVSLLFIYLFICLLLLVLTKILKWVDWEIRGLRGNLGQGLRTTSTCSWKRGLWVLLFFFLLFHKARCCIYNIPPLIPCYISIAFPYCKTLGTFTYNDDTDYQYIGVDA
ncbi:hypothetical protein F5Y11DRAFT_155155 [Daldinia sp. FL1419]|nr:hypothetical protein F5Y11DRAFT_155155 [Daldinia sp. FL1419]